ncbi:MAG TPA: RHS repeat-associated core domain-containing protein [Thermoguttaceae bacterium]|nr:RHS repeat-associated core domain-containing protein [Thermoguttaceae bacterium]
MAAPTRASTVPGGADQASESNDTLLITTYGYDSASGRLTTVTTPGGVAGSVTTQTAKTFYDDLGRKTFVAENWADFSPPSTGAGGGSNNDQDKVTRFVYNGLGNVTELVAMNATTGDQSTKYLYEDSYNAALATGTIYPDSSDTDSTGTDQVKVSYYLDGQPNTRTDQRGTVLTHVYDAQRRLSYQGATTLGGATDNHVRAIKREYDSLGRIEKITSYSGADATGTVRNQVQYAYDDLGRKSIIYQEHNGEVNDASEGGTDSLSTRFIHDDSATGNVFINGGRLATVAYPDGSGVAHAYTTGVSDLLNRTKYLEDDSSEEIVGYYHNGVARPVRVKMLNMAPLMLDYYQGASGTYAGFDRFGRVKDQKWVNWSPEPDAALVQIGHGYDLAGNRIWREDVKAAAASVDLDEFYTYDGLHRVKNLDRGALDEGKTAVSGTPAWEEDWSLDELGNWNGYDQKTSGTTTLDQGRLHNKANEIDNDNNHANQPSGSITASTGTNWADPTHDAAGNMTTIPKQSPALAYTGVYDAWNRLVRLQSGQDPEAEYAYDGLNQLIVNKIYASGQVAEKRHFYYNNRWQCLEERLESDGTISSYADIRYVWGLRYVDELVLRQRDTDADGTLDETLYALQDANFNVVALAEPDGDVVERFIYNAYGQATQLDPDFTAYGGEDYLWDYLYTGRSVDRESGLMYYRNRFYHTGLGRFVNRDPIGYRGSKWNLYQYVLGRVLQSVDPSGLDFDADVSNLLDGFGTSYGNFFGDGVSLNDAECAKHISQMISDGQFLDAAEATFRDMLLDALTSLGGGSLTGQALAQASAAIANLLAGDPDIDAALSAQIAAIIQDAAGDIPIPGLEEMIDQLVNVAGADEATHVTIDPLYNNGIGESVDCYFIRNGNGPIQGWCEYKCKPGKHGAETQYCCCGEQGTLTLSGNTNNQGQPVPPIFERPKPPDTGTPPPPGGLQLQSSSSTVIAIPFSP